MANNLSSLHVEENVNSVSRRFFKAIHEDQTNELMVNAVFLCAICFVWMNFAEFVKKYILSFILMRFGLYFA